MLSLLTLSLVTLPLVSTQTSLQKSAIPVLLLTSRPATVQERAKIRSLDDRAIPADTGLKTRRFEISPQGTGPVWLVVEETLLPDAYFRNYRRAFSALRSSWKTGQMIDLDARGNEPVRDWLRGEVSPTEYARTSRFTLSMSKTVTLTGGGRTLNYDIDGFPELPDTEFVKETPKRPSSQVATTASSTAKLPYGERHFYHLKLSPFLDEFVLQGEATQWLGKKWRDASEAFRKEFADLYAALESDRRLRELVEEAPEGTAVGDLSERSRKQLEVHFGFGWKRYGFASEAEAVAWVSGSRIGSTVTGLNAVAGGLLPNGERYGYVQRIHLP